MLTRLYADNYKCLVNFELRFKDVTLLLGTNGAGKSSVLDVVYRLKQLLVDGRRIGDAEVFPARTRTRGGQRDIQTIALDVDLDGELFQYKLEVEHEEGDTGRARVRLESLKTSGGALFHCSLGDAQLYRDDHSVDETRGDYPRLPRAGACQRHVEALAAMCERGHLRTPAPASLQDACEKYQRFRTNLQP